MQKTYLSYQVFTKLSPFMQMLWVLGIGVVAMFIGDLWSANEEMAWIVGSMVVGFYAWLNALISFFIAKKQAKYFFTSLFFFALTCIVVYGVGSFLSPVEVWNMYEYRMMFSITVAFYILGSLVVTLMKNIAQALQITY
ncbi:MAG: hypothetical protein AB8B69_03180 [Chitinophagales bacterium]